MNDPLAPKGPGKGQHPNSRAALVPGGKAGVRVRITKSFVLDRLDWLEENRNTFNEMMLELQQRSPRDWVAAYLKLMDMIVPKKLDVETTEMPATSWTITPASAAQAQLLKEAQEVPDLSPNTSVDFLEFMDDEQPQQA